jgi:hypothetical protein
LLCNVTRYGLNDEPCSGIDRIDDVRFNTVLLIENPNNPALRPRGRRFAKTALGHQDHRLSVCKVKGNSKAG